ncbi:hypothetical protein C4D60_Mb01t21390 [Musa balbisiana]|uniref:ACB domain-containing protein n=1 Tax=Musa balbisiana TaxID=52838 RepID=A0A4S8JQJ9_MUSBA|nr:hypothetical protein C4D60_Mb01t21390 [Musa balbisiana]
MEFYVELFLTALISVLLVFLIGKIAAADDNVDDEDLAADKPAPPPLSADLGPRRMESTAAATATATADLGMGLGATEEEETGKSSGDACASGVVLGATDRPETGVTHVEDQRLDEEILDSGKAASGFDLQKQDTILGVDESSSKKEGSKVGIGIISGDLDEVEPNVGKEVRKIVEMGGEDTLQRGDARAMSEERGGSLLQGEDEWEGIERSELEKLFGVATEFVGSEKGGDAVSKLSSELQMQLYGLHRVATEGPCYEPQPMALKVTARAKWHAWQSLGNMNPDAAMEKYISLTKSIPGWMGEKSGEEARGHEDNNPSVVQVSGIGQHHLKTSSYCNPETERTERASRSNCSRQHGYIF